MQPEATRFASKVINSRVRSDGVSLCYNSTFTGTSLPSMELEYLPSDFEPALGALQYTYELDITATHALKPEQVVESQG